MCEAVVSPGRGIGGLECRKGLGRMWEAGAVVQGDCGVAGRGLRRCYGGPGVSPRRVLDGTGVCNDVLEGLALVQAVDVGGDEGVAPELEAGAALRRSSDIR